MSDFYDKVLEQHRKAMIDSITTEEWLLEDRSQHAAAIRRKKHEERKRTAAQRRSKKHRKQLDDYDREQAWEEKNGRAGTSRIQDKATRVESRARSLKKLEDEWKDELIDEGYPPIWLEQANGNRPPDFSMAGPDKSPWQAASEFMRSLGREMKIDLTEAFEGRKPAHVPLGFRLAIPLRRPI